MKLSFVISVGVTVSAASRGNGTQEPCIPTWATGCSSTAGGSCCSDRNCVADQCQPPDPSSKSCTGRSVQLKPEQCRVWQEDIYDGMGGTGWRDCSDKRSDPCSCRRLNCNGTDITGMYVVACSMIVLSCSIIASSDISIQTTSLEAFQAPSPS